MYQSKYQRYFDITGFFYVESAHGYKCRSFLNIKRIGVESLDDPDLMVVMMNPGSSAPLSGDDDGRIEDAASPDETQDRIMRVMQEKRFNFARILNLSDYRDQDSNTFKPMISTLDAKFPEHTIFHANRSTEFSDLYNPSVNVIVGWGSDKILARLATLAFTQISQRQIVGVRNRGKGFKAYYHPGRHGGWHEEIISQLP